ncbi:MAG: esterase-like activity of phytase family protein [Sulfurovum sp.]|nr:MAG: esterase-like activity of phytase family protein [Sulfurovum sp.]
MRYLLSLLVGVSLLFGDIHSTEICPDRKHRVSGINILDQKVLDIGAVQGVKFAEISDLAYDAKHQRLYMVGDKGALFAFGMTLAGDNLSLHPLRAAYLRDKRGKRLRKWKRDSEGMCVDGRGRLLVSFEGDVKIAWVHKEGRKFGRMIRTFPLPKELRKISRFRSKNKSLEALTWHPRYGILTAPEWPLKKYHKKRHVVYSLRGKRWSFRAEPEARSSLVAMETMDDGNLLVLERSYTGLFSPFVITLKKVFLKGCKKRCKSKVLAKFNTHKGWDIDNFEGLTRVGKRRYLMVSDNGDNFYQKTLLIYFEVL